LSKYIILSALLVFLITGLSLAQEADNSSAMENATVPENITATEEVAAVEGEVASENATTEEPVANETAAETVANLKYIWLVNGIEADKITMALNQEGTNLFGQAKYEPEGAEPWNGVVVGSIAGDKVALVLTALKGDVLVSTMLDATFADEALSGSYFQTSEGQISGQGEFSAMWITDDLTGYAPATIEQPEPEPAPAETAVAEAAEETQAPVQLGSSSRFVDVRQYKDKIGPGGDLSGIPPGMSGAI